MPAPALLGAAARVLGTSVRSGMIGYASLPGRRREHYRQLLERREEIGEGLFGVALGATKAGAALAALGGLGSAAVLVTKALQGLSTKILDNQRSIAFLNPLIAASFARLDYNQLRLNARLAAGTSQTTATLANQVIAMQNAAQPFREATTNLKNVAGTFASLLATAIYEAANKAGLPDTLNSIAEAWGLIFRGGLRNQLGVEDYRQFFREMKKGNFGNPINQRPGKDGRF